MSDSPPTRRRWLQGGLGTMLLLVTVFALWLGWELKFIRERQAWIQDNEPMTAAANGGGIVNGLDIAMFADSKAGEEATVPTWRRWLGDEAHDVIFLPKNADAAARKKATRLFPESVVFDLD